MANKVSSLFVNIGADTSEFRKEIDQMQSTLKKALGSDLMSVSKTALHTLAGLAVGMGAFGAASVKAAGEMEQYKVAFTTMLGSAAKAEAKLKEMEKFAAGTPFDLPSVVEGTKRLIAMGFKAEETQKILTSIGDTSAGLGMGSEGINRLTLVLGQMRTAGKVTSQDMMQLTSAGVNAWQYLADAAGVSISEIKEMARKGSLDSVDAIKTIMEGMDKQFGGLMEAQRDTLLGAFDAMEDSVQQTMVRIGDSLNKAFDISGAINYLADQMQIFKDTVADSGLSAAIRDVIPPEITLGVFAFSGALTTAALPALNLLTLSAIKASAAMLSFAAPGMMVSTALWAIWQAGASVQQMVGAFALMLTAATIPAVLKFAAALLTGNTVALPQFVQALLAAGNSVVAFGAKMYGYFIASTIESSKVLLSQGVPAVIRFTAALGGSLLGAISSASKLLSADFYVSIYKSATAMMVQGVQSTVKMTTSLTKNLIPAITSTATSLLTRLVPGLVGVAGVGTVSFATLGVSAKAAGVAIWAALAPILILGAKVIVGIAAIAAVVYGLYKLWENFGDYIKSFFPSALGVVYDWASGLWSAFLEFIQPAINLVKSLTAEIGNLLGIASDAGNLGSSLQGAFDSLRANSPLSTLTDAASTGGGGSGGKGKGKGVNPAKEAQKVAKEINDAWRSVTQTQLGELNDWYKEMTEKLEKYKAVNETYQKDLTRLQETYSLKRQKIIHDEMKAQEDTLRAFSRETQDLMKEAYSMNLKGSALGEFNIADRLDGGLRKLEDFAEKAKETLYKAEQDLSKARASGDSAEIARAEGYYAKMLEISKRSDDAALQYRLSAEQKKQEEAYKYQASGQALRDDLARAYDEYDLQSYMELLGAKETAHLSYLEGQQALMDTYYQLQMEANRSMASYLAETYTTFSDGLAQGLSDVLMGTQSLGEAFATLGQSMLQMVVDFAAQRMASMIALQLFGDTANKKEFAQVQALETKKIQSNASVAASAKIAATTLNVALKGIAATAAAAQVALANATGAAVAAAWAPAAAMVSLATMGKNSAAANAGIAATVAFSETMAMPKLASGGITTGATIAMIGEGKYNEAVLPLNGRVLAPIFSDAMDLSEGTEGSITVTNNNYGAINNGSDLDSLLDAFSGAVVSARRGS